MLPRDSVVTTSLLVLGRPTYLSSRVQGDVVVVGGDLFLRPGSDVAGSAIAIGGGVYRSLLGTVGGAVESYRDDDYSIVASDAGYELAYRGDGATIRRRFSSPGLQGLLAADRTIASTESRCRRRARSRSAIAPSSSSPIATYRSRLG